MIEAESAGGTKTRPMALSPGWVEWLMGWVPGWTSLEPLNSALHRAWLRAFRTALTDCAPLATDRFHSWLQQHGCYCGSD